MIRSLRVYCLILVAGAACSPKAPVEQVGDPTDPPKAREFKDPDVKSSIAEIEELLAGGLQLGPVTKGSTVGAEQFWGHGTLVGVPGKAMKSWAGVNIYSVDFLLAGGIQGINQGTYSSIRMVGTVFRQSIFDEYKALTTSLPMVMRYVTKAYYNPGKYITVQPSYYWIYRLESPPRFEDTPSFKRARFMHNEEETSFWQKGWRASGTRTGYIAHVKRWGFFGGVTCSLFLHEGGTKQVGVTAAGLATVAGITMAVMPGLSENQQKAAAITAGVVAASRIKDVPNINGYNIFSEEGCQFAEDAAKSVSKVKIDLSEGFLPTWNIYKGIVHKITVTSLQEEVEERRLR